MTITRQRLTREQSRAETRNRLVDAAGRVFARRGFHGASVEEVAEEAGHSKGAVYSNFTSKEDLFLTLLERRCELSVDRIAATFTVAGSLDERVTRAADLLTSMIQVDSDDALLFVELWTYAVREPEVARRMATMYADVRRRVAEVVTTQAEEVGVALPAAADDVAAALVALNDGLILQTLVDPERFPPDIVAALLFVVLGGMASLSSVCPAPGIVTQPAPPVHTGPRSPRREFV